jgi:hypothetical protein
MRRLPARIARRNRNNAEAERNAQYYRKPIEPAKRCACTHSDDEHYFGGRCDKCPCQRFQERAA